MVHLMQASPPEIATIIFKLKLKNIFKTFLYGLDIVVIFVDSRFMVVAVAGA